MTIERQFLADILAHPQDDTPRLIYADWLDDNAETRSCGCRGGQVYGMGEGSDDVYRNRWSTCPRCNGAAVVPDERSAHAEFIRTQCALGVIDNEVAALGPCYCSGPDPTGCGRCRKGERLGLWVKRQSLRKREAELLVGYPGWHPWAGSARLVLPDGKHFAEYLTFRRGFVEALTCTAEDWIAHADAITAEHPIREVQLTTEVGWSHRNGSVYLHDWSPPPLNYVKGRRCKNVRIDDNPSDIENHITYIEGCLRAEWPRVIKWNLTTLQSLTGNPFLDEIYEQGY